MQLSAVRLFVRELAPARVFYQQALGLELRLDQPQQGFCLFRSAGLDLLLERVPPEAPAEEQALVGRFTGLSFRVEDIRASHAALGAGGVRFDGEPELQAWGGWLATLFDPAGNGLQLVQPPAGA
ncbi:glyoxalase/bleomycin resistance/dioxygenase family protein [Roseateles sp. DAIF2]|uniref:VOC family protein n=1 Tax=Roseateles sp. DAIF2 TaxID=2714952 RepID=UPI0018A25D5A|nr:VOC family protein [Roseateles sp. DAIF2]QPF76284.1 glyoxalase/bleomycin resistance/dioxygenase family protein [Roseateles sp. DAIF2]